LALKQILLFNEPILGNENEIDPMSNQVYSLVSGQLKTILLKAIGVLESHLL
jgi:hypothetical protein